MGGKWGAPSMSGNKVGSNSGNKRRFPSFNKFIPFFFVFFLIAVIALAFLPQKSLEEKKAEIILLMNEKYGKKEIPSIELIENVSELKKTKNAVYSGAENGMFLVKWAELWVIYDYETKKIVKEIAIGGINL